jgi:hypothetical protein
LSADKLIGRGSAPLQFTFGAGPQIYLHGANGPGDDMGNITRNATSFYTFFWSGAFQVAGRLTVGDQLYLNGGWFRSQQSGTGWYSEPHAGGWFMQDNSWIRNYNNKGILLSQGQGSGGAAIRLEATSPTIEWYDTDRNTQSWIHYNDGSHGFLAENSFSWACFRNSGNDWQCQSNIIAYASDRRLKKNIVDVPRDIVENFYSKLRIRLFDWDEEAISKYKVGIKPVKGEVGGIAQEFQEILPSSVAVNEAHNEIKTEDNPNPLKPDILTIQWDKTVPMAHAEILSLRERVASLEALVEKLINDKSRLD